MATIYQLNTACNRQQPIIQRKNVVCAATKQPKNSGESKCPPALDSPYCTTDCCRHTACMLAPEPLQLALSETAGSGSIPLPGWALGSAIVLGGVAAGKKVFDTPAAARPAAVDSEYDAWTDEGILEYFWGEHIHLGHYSPAEISKGYKKKDFKDAKLDFTKRMIEWAGLESTPKTVLDVGCGIGGSSRYLAKRFGAQTEVKGITLSPKQVERATELAKEQNVKNTKFEVMDALKMDYPDNSFDLVWACESGEHMPDKVKYVQEMTRVLKPGGTLVFATWCQRPEPPEFTEKEKKKLQFLYEEWSHPYFISIPEYAKIMMATNQLDNIETADWTDETLPSWRHSIWVGVYDPWPVLSKPKTWYRIVRDMVTLERMHRAFDSGLMQYGMFRARKKT